MIKPFGTLPDGRSVSLYTIAGHGLKAMLAPLGATLVRLYTPDKNGVYDDIVLGYRDAAAYKADWMNIGATVGRCANRIRGGTFTLGGQTYTLPQNNMGNNLHSGPDFYSHRLWEVENYTDASITFYLESPHMDQGFPGNAKIRITYSLQEPMTLSIRYEAVSDRDTILNLTNHSCFNLRGHQHPEAAMQQLLMLPSSKFIPCDETFVPTGEIRDVAGTPMDFRTPKPIGKDIHADYPPLRNPKGYDHSYPTEGPLCATLSDPVSGRVMEVYTDSPCVHVYSGNYIDLEGKDNVYYCDRAGVALETQFYPDAIHHPHWPQPIAKANEVWTGKTDFVFK
ncbi:MAG: galactose mutarotase [Oscillospiraceae bacterium]|nr:galactose mutarotase [Oscillospiraceae bacterium]